MTGVNSHILTIFVRELLENDLDALVLYIGNNEVVGPFGPGSPFGGFHGGSAWPRIALALRRLRLTMLLNETRLRWGLHTRAWAGLSEFADRPVAPDDPRLPAMYASFSNNITFMVEAARRRDVPVVLATVPVNLRDWPPLTSAPGPLHAATAYREAQRLDAAGAHTEADSYYLRARDWDLHRLRADSRINDILRTIAAAYPHNVVLVDAERRFLDARADDRLFLEHVHLTIEGKVRLALLLAEGLRTALPTLASAGSAQPSIDEVRGALCYTPYDERDTWQSIGELLATPLFAGQADHTQRIARCLASLQAADRTAREFGVAGLIRAAQTAQSLRPDDPEAPLILGRHLFELGDLPAAIEALSVAITRHPFNPESQLNLGRALRAVGRPADAERPLREALALKPDFVPALLELSAALGMQRKSREGLRYARRALRLQPSRAEAWATLGHLHAQREETDGAIAAFRKALEFHPVDPELLNNLAWFLLVKGDAYDEALELARRAAAQAPDHPHVQGTLAAALAKAGRFAEAAAAADRAAALGDAAGLADFSAETRARAAAYRRGDLPDLR